MTPPPRPPGDQGSILADQGSSLAAHGKADDDLAGAGVAVGKRFILLLAAFAALAPLCTDLYLPVLPRLATDLGVAASTAQLTITAVLLGLAAGQVVAGPLSDRFGRRPVLILGLVAFGSANLLSAVMPSAGPLVIVRLFAGLSAAAAVVVTRAIVADAFPGTRAAQGYAALGAVTGIAPAVAPLLGGALSLVMGWRGMFVVLTGLAGALVVLAWWRVPETLPVDRRLSAHPRAVVAGLLDCVRSRRFAAYMLCVAAAGGVLFGYIAGSSFVLQDLHGWSPRGYSLVFAVNSLGIFLCANISRRLVPSVGPGRLLWVGQGIALLGATVLLAGQLLAPVTGDGVGSVLAGFFLCVASIGFVFSNATALGMRVAPGGAGAASGMLGIMSFATGALLAPLTGLGHSGLPMAVVMFGCAVAGPVLRVLMLGIPRTGRPG